MCSRYIRTLVHSYYVTTVTLNIDTVNVHCFVLQVEVHELVPPPVCELEVVLSKAPVEVAEAELGKENNIILITK